jgi:hypothetical protein
LETVPIPAEEQVALPGAVKQAITRALFAACEDPTHRHSLRAVAWGHVSDGVSDIVTSDTYRLYRERVECDVPEGHGPAPGEIWLLCAETLREVLGTKAMRDPKAALLVMPPLYEGETFTVTEKSHIRGRQEVEVEVDYALGARNRNSRAKDRRAPARHVRGNYPAWPAILSEDPVLWSGSVRLGDVGRAVIALEGVANADEADCIRVAGNGTLDISAGLPGLYAMAELEAAEIAGERDFARVWLEHGFLAEFLETIAADFSDGSCVEFILRQPLTLQTVRCGAAEYHIMPRNADIHDRRYSEGVK